MITLNNLEFVWQRLLLFGLMATTGIFVSTTNVVAQGKAKPKDDGVAVIRGKIAYDKALVESWDGNRLVIPYKEINAKIRQRVVPPAPPYPKGIEKWKHEDILKWEKQFIETAAGKKFLEDQQKLLEGAQ